MITQRPGLIAGALTGTPALIAAGGITLAVTGLVTTANLALGPLRILQSASRPTGTVVRLTEGGPA